MKIKVLKSDNDGDFCSITINKFYKENNIERIKKTPYIS